MIGSEDLYWNEKYNLEERQTQIYYQNLNWLALRPSTVYKPKLIMDGDQWCALFGDNIQEGVCGFGKSPEKAMLDFDREWDKELKQIPIKELFN